MSIHFVGKSDEDDSEGEAVVAVILDFIAETELWIPSIVQSALKKVLLDVRRPEVN